MSIFFCLLCYFLFEKRVDSDMKTYLDYVIEYVVYFMKYQGTSGVFADTIVGNKDEFNRTRNRLRVSLRGKSNLSFFF